MSSGQPVEPRHDQYIALIEPLEQVSKLGRSLQAPLTFFGWILLQLAPRN